MNRVILLMAFLSIFSLSKAQFSVGARYGYSSCGIHLESTDRIDLEYYQTEYYLPHFGLVVAFNNKFNSGLQMEFIYAQKGWKDAHDSIPNSFATRTINFLEIPVFSHFEIGQKALRPVIILGPYMAFKISESTDTSNFHYFDTYDPYHQKVRSMTLGIKAGIGLRYNINKRLAIFAEGRYDIQVAGSSDIFIDRPNTIQASRLKEVSGTFGIIWHIIPQTPKDEKKGYVPKENLYELE